MTGRPYTEDQAERLAIMTALAVVLQGFTNVIDAALGAQVDVEVETLQKAHEIIRSVGERASIKLDEELDNG